jgi:hypothetical protein
MDKENLVDNEPSVKLKIKSDDSEGFIRFSSVYGSYNYICDYQPVKDSISRFFCPNCNSMIKSDVTCEHCKAPMVPLFLDIGGKVAFCSRAGCKNHFVEFEDLSNALRKFYQDYGNHQKLNSELKEVDKIKNLNINLEELDDSKEIIETGTFLHTYCPHCKRSINESDMLKMRIINDKNEEGYVFLSPYLNVFTTRSTIFLKEDTVIKDLKCFHCDTSLILTDKKCDICGSPVAVISIGARSKLIDFYICSKKGCRWHGLSEDDINEIKLEDSLNW